MIFLPQTLILAVWHEYEEFIYIEGLGPLINTDNRCNFKIATETDTWPKSFMSLTGLLLGDKDPARGRDFDHSGPIRLLRRIYS